MTRPYHNKLGYPSPMFDLGEDQGYVDASSVSFQKWVEIGWESGSLTSGKLALEEPYHAVSLYLPHQYTGSTIGFNGSYDLDDLFPIGMGSGLITYPVASRAISLEPSLLYGWSFIQFRSPNAQIATTIIKVRVST